MRDPLSNSVPNSSQNDDAVSRRDFVRTLAAGAALPLIGGRAALAEGDKAAKIVGPTASAPAETAVARFYTTLTPAQKKLICFPFNHPKRRMVNNNWKIVEPSIDDLSKEQQALCEEIFKNLCSEEGYERFSKQMSDDYGGFGSYHVAVFGEPGTDKPFEWVLSGRHDTLRADGNSVDGAAFGGPIFYGHAADGHANEDAKHTNNVWWYQGVRANELFKSLDDKERARALITQGKAEGDTPRSIILKGDKLARAGLSVSDLDGQQKEIVKKMLADMLSPFRATDVEEVHSCLAENGGIDKLQITYYKDGDIGNDGVWDIWKLEGPAFSWYFHGSPHVHTWLNVARKADAYEPPNG
ncbi:MAG: DUF3500 domain-containing protein [Isosphaeraceae bacterium]|nr:DUF3500 domain-containing protein [Isosphaeraceae bacterium]